METDGARTTIAAPSFPVFAIVYTAGMSASAAWLAFTLYTQSTRVEGAPFLLLTPVALLIGSRWVGRSSSLLSLILRSIIAHAIAPLIPVYLMALAHSNAPGASGHGGMFLVVIYLFPIAIAAGVIFGIVDALAAFAAMKLVRKR